MACRSPGDDLQRQPPKTALHDPTTIETRGPMNSCCMILFCDYQGTSLVFQYARSRFVRSCCTLVSPSESWPLALLVVPLRLIGETYGPQPRILLGGMTTRDSSPLWGVSLERGKKRLIGEHRQIHTTGFCQDA